MRMTCEETSLELRKLLEMDVSFEAVMQYMVTLLTLRIEDAKRYAMAKDEIGGRPAAEDVVKMVAIWQSTIEAIRESSELVGVLEEVIDSYMAEARKNAGPPPKST